MKTILLISPYWKEEHRWMVSTVKLAELWQRLGYKVVVVCMGKGEGNKAEGQKGSFTERVSDTLEIYRVPDFFIPDPWNYGIAFGFSGKVVKIAKEIKPDVIVVNKVLFWTSIALLRLRIAGYKVLLTTDALVGITWWPRGKIASVCASIYAWTLGWMILKAATRIVFFHPQPTATLQRLGISEKSIVIPTGIDPTNYRNSKFKRTNSKQDVTITYVGRLESVKGVDDFVIAALDVKRDHPTLEIQVVGWFKPNLLLAQENQDKVTFTGLLNDIPAVLAETDIFVLPSYSEGLSNALMEAMASGCACITTNVGGNVFLIQNGVSGFLFEPGDRDALASHIRRLIDDPAKRESLGKAARARIDQQFSWQSVGKQYDELFKAWIASRS